MHSYLLSKTNKENTYLYTSILPNVERIEQAYWYLNIILLYGYVPSLFEILRNLKNFY